MCLPYQQSDYDALRMLCNAQKERIVKLEIESADWREQYGVYVRIADKAEAKIAELEGLLKDATKECGVQKTENVQLEAERDRLRDLLSELDKLCKHLGWLLTYSHQKRIDVALAASEQGEPK